jgi:peptidoglycan/LPS O-acetylase OafA/YrhL
MLSWLTRPLVSNRRNFHGIDLLRGISAFVILVWHYNHFNLGGGSISIPASAIDHVGLLRFKWWLLYGPWAIMMFWTISGFVFMNVYAGRRTGARTFFVNRFARLYPLHFATLLIVAVIQYVSMRNFGHWMVTPYNDAYHFVLQLFFASEWGFQQGRSFNGPIWSVSAEVLIYVAFFLYVRFGRVNLAWTVALCGLFTILSKIAPGNPILLCGTFFFGGASLYALYLLCDGVLRPKLMIAMLATFLIIAAAGLAVGPRIHVPLTFWLLPLFGSLLLAVAISDELYLGAAYKRLHIVGDITYSVYLCQEPLQLLFLLGASFGLWSVLEARSDLFFAGYISLTCVVAWLSYRYFERPAQHWLRERLLHKKRDIALIAAP